MHLDIEHGTLMDQVYRHQRHLYDATRKFYLLGRDSLIDDLDPPPGGRVLEIGCGTGRNLIATAQLYPTVECFGIDISTAMLETARKAAQRANLRDRVHLELGDATRLTPWPIFGVKRYDRVFMSYTLSMIPGWRLAISEAINVLTPNGRLHIVDFGSQSDLPSWFCWALNRWLALFHVAPRMDLADELKGKAAAGRSHAIVRSLYRGYTTYAVVRPSAGLL